LDEDGAVSTGGYNAAAWLVDRHVEAGEGHRTAVVGGERLTYEDLLRRVWRVQNALAALGVHRSERVALVVDDTPDALAWLLGALRSGVVPVPLSTMATGADLGALVADGVAVAAVVTAGYADRLPAIRAAAPDLRATVVVGEPGAAGGAGDAAAVAWDDLADPAEAPVAATTGDSPGLWLASSGTTGRPKLVMHRHAALQATADGFGRSVLGLRSDDRFLSASKLFFAYGLGTSLTFPLAAGGTSVLCAARATVDAFAPLVADERPTVVALVPAFVAALVEADLPPGALGSVRVATSAGEVLPADLHRRFTERFGVPLLDGIGATEALNTFLSNRIGHERPGTSGQPVDGYEVRLLDDDGDPVTEPDTPGLLHLKGPSVADGYWARHDATQGAFRGEWLHTGDVYERSADGYWTARGRANDLIKAGGIWVSPLEVESVLVEHPDVREAAVVGVRDGRGLESVVAFVVPRDGHTVDEAALEAHCRERMAAFKRPRQVVVTDELPKTATGKVRRFVLRDRLAGPAESAPP
jgi:benzoate-CoA ligase family protein